MKRIRLKEAKAPVMLVALAVCAMMIVAFAGCGAKQETSTEPEPAPEETATQQDQLPAPDPAPEPEKPTAEYDITDGMEINSADGMKYFYGNDFLLIMPDTDVWDYEKVDSDSIEFYYKPARDAGCGGNLVTIMAFDEDDTSYENFPDFAVAGKGNNSGKVFVALFPTDVQFEASQQKEYTELYNHVKKIGEGNTDSPFSTR